MPENCANNVFLDAKTLEPRLSDLLPDMLTQMRADLLPLLHGNLGHIAQVREQARRNERVLDWRSRSLELIDGGGGDGEKPDCAC